MSDTATTPRLPDETGVPDPFQFMHPTMKKNYGNWDWHERLRPGVLHHVSKTGESIYTVRAGTQRQMDVYTIRKLCDIADDFGESTPSILKELGYTQDQITEFTKNDVI